MHEKDPYNDDEIDLKELFTVLWNAKIFIIKVTAVFAVGTLSVSLMLSDYYQSESILIIRTDSENNRLLSQYSGLASLAGINLQSTGDDKTLEAIELIKSRKFVKHLLTFEDILPSIMAQKSYDPTTKELSFDADIYDGDLGEWTRIPKNNQGIEPSYLEAHEIYLNQIMKISLDDRTGLLSISVEHISPVFAKEFLDLIIREANVLIRKRDIEESAAALDYLKSELSKTSLIEIQESINSLIEAQLERQMLAQVNEEYVLIEIEPPFIAEKKSWPSRAFICIIGTFIGGIISIFIALTRHYQVYSNN